MASHKEGGRKAAQTNIERYGADFYRRIGKIGGAHSTTGGYASDKVGVDGLTGRQRAKVAGRKVGRLSKRGCQFLGVEDGMAKYLRKATGEVFTAELPNLDIK